MFEKDEKEELRKSRPGRIFLKLCGLRIIAEEAQGYIEQLILNRDNAAAEAEMTEWSRVHERLFAPA